VSDFYYICDGCGDMVTITAEPIPEDEEWTCEKCGSHALWELRPRAVPAHSGLEPERPLRWLVMLREVRS
jgi:DNA-directed RNA polymerase subunit RPC12/RpoP